jgi:hypothetical protein
MTMMVAVPRGPSPRSEGCPDQGECPVRHMPTWGDGDDTRDRLAIL